MTKTKVIMEVLVWWGRSSASLTRMMKIRWQA